MPLSSSCISIELLPEFGWSIKDQAVYGPGSVFQGFVKLNMKALDVERVRLVFYATETIPPFDIAPGVMRTSRHTLFSIQQVLWESKDQALKVDTNSDCSLPFTIQMPMVQFPPSISHSVYECLFQLIAIVDTPASLQKKAMPIKTEIPVICMPFIETSILKTPLLLESQNGRLSARIKMATKDFVPCDFVSIGLHVDSANNGKKRSNTLQYVTVQLKLIQTMQIRVFDDIPDQTKTVASAAQKLLLISRLNGNSSYCDADLSLKIPADVTPSYNYGRLVQISYKLQVSVEQKGPMGGIWNYMVSIDDIPMTIGTLGHGIRSSNELQMYSSCEQRNSDMLVPKFMKAIEYEDALPVYDPCRLPDYTTLTTATAAINS
ncbi:hypothetical protein CU098_010700 [Rhizopus stolonifer]|uniref:Arrestin C-terminal-like domain-containing protein n=1 Tax=Rhizopus stolonifer TaxID=4846 RepID=A0A367KHL6_RHIST|nr:hypothetical protein CU098_010700 [Rhizopus stolonifer]